MNHKSNVDGEGFTEVYVDGCWLPRQNAAGYGIFWGENNSKNFAGQSRRDATNNVAEIQAAVVAIQEASRMGITKLRIITDSNNLYDAVTTNIPEWKRNGWRSLYDRMPIKNRTDFEELDRNITSNPRMNIKFRVVTAHCGNQKHNKADRLAAVGARLHQ